MSIEIISVSDRYIDYLKRDPKTQGRVFDNKQATRLHTRKYLRVNVGEHEFYIPFSSAKPTDYRMDIDNHMHIRASVTPIIRITDKNSKTREMELLGTLKLSNMIAVPEGERIAYSIDGEPDESYKNLMLKEYRFIQRNLGLIQYNAKTLYNEKMLEKRHPDYASLPGYLENCVDYEYTEQKCCDFSRMPEMEKEIQICAEYVGL